jgi:hypothetical protein
LAVLGVALGGALGQTASPDSALLRPGEDWAPGHPPRFQKVTPTFGNPPGFGAGKSGFDSTNNARKAQAAAKAKTTIVAKPLPPPQTTAAAPLAATPPASGLPPSTAAAPPITTATVTARPKRKPAPESDPYDALGIPVGSFLLRPAIELSGGYDSNPARGSDASGSSLFIVAPELQIRSDWARHDLRADIRGSYTNFTSQSALSRPYFESKIDGRVDWTSQTRIDLQNRFVLSTDNPGSPNLTADVAKAPIFTTLGGTAGIAHRFNRAEIGMKGSVDRTSYQDSSLTDGSVASNADRNFNQYGLVLRGSYELTPGIKPFAEIDTDSRVHDLALDSSGMQRDSKGFSPKIGTSFELTRQLTGEVSVGYLVRSYKDPRLRELRGLIADASLVWSATPLTTATFIAKSSADESTLTDVSGVLARDIGVQVDHSFRRWLIGSLKLGYGVDDYVGSTRADRRFAASAAITYKLTRTMQIKGEVRRETRSSNAPGQDYTANVFLVGLRLQR